jgi:hypothetical protein
VSPYRAYRAYRAPLTSGATVELAPGSYTFAEEELVEIDAEQRFASALGTPDENCHIVIGDGPWSYTLCGQNIDPAAEYAHPAAGNPWDCPGGHPSCPRCVELVR